jgi:hypothetical protein
MRHAPTGGFTALVPLSAEEIDNGASSNSERASGKAKPQKNDMQEEKESTPAAFREPSSASERFARQNRQDCDRGLSRWEEVACWARVGAAGTS